MDGSTKDSTARSIRASRYEHGALAQLLRWYSYYEEPKVPVENLLDLLDENVYMKMSAGEARGRQAFLAANAEVPRLEWKNAHQIDQVQFTAGPEDAPTHLRLETEYANTGTDPTGALRSARLAYDVGLAYDPMSPLPRITSLVTTPLTPGRATEVVDCYATNRVRSLVHYWLALTESPHLGVEPFTEILAPNFHLGFPPGPIDSLDAFASWLAGPASSVAAARHEIVSFNVTPTGSSTSDETTALNAEFHCDWQGLLADGTEMAATTHHTWSVLDDPTWRFAKIAEVTVAIVRPFRNV